MNYITGSLSKHNSWGDSTTEIPIGIIKSISIVIDDCDSSIVLTNLKVTKGVFSVTFCRRKSSQPTKAVAFGKTDKEGSVLFLDTRDCCLSCVLELGLFKDLELDLELNIPINKSSILAVPRTSQDSFEINVTQDGITETERLHEDYELIVDPRLSCNYVESNKTVIISLSEDNSRALKSVFIETQPEIDRLLSINNVRPNQNGDIYVNISNDSAPLEFIASDTFPAITISSNISPCDTEDVIDKHISPTLLRTFSYMPLDDAYTCDADGYSRATKERLLVYNELDPLYDDTTAAADTAL